MKAVQSFLFAFFLLICIDFSFNEQTYNKEETNIAKTVDGRLLIFATLDGTLYAIDQTSGQIKWKIKDRPIVEVPKDTKDAIFPVLLPDPRDGALYLLGDSKEPLKKLPFTIPELVSSSPCRSSDGILYTGKKKDTWFKLDPSNGNRQQILGWDVPSPTCPIGSNSFVYIGRTKYNIMMVDSANGNRKWNVTFLVYTASPMSKEQKQNYDFVHFTSTSTGRLVTMDRIRGNLVWEGDLGSPVIGAYLLDKDGLIMAPFTSLANHTLSYLATNLVTNEGLTSTHMKLYPTLYVGQHIHGLYAISSLVDANVVAITASDEGPLMLDGPFAPDKPQPYATFPLPDRNYRLPQKMYDSDKWQSMQSFSTNFKIYVGHYNVPDYDTSKIMIGGNPNPRLITDESIKPSVPKIPDQSDQNNQKPINKETQTDFGSTQTEFFENKESEFNGDEVIKVDSVGTLNSLKRSYLNLKQWINQQENKGLKLTLIILSGSVVAMFWYLQIQIRETQQLSQNGSRSSQASSFGRNGAVTAIAQEMPDGLIKVGKITFHPDQLLGKGCEGTFVYRGEFDNRRVAVKRLLPECFTFADREVALLRESDAHPNVIRYFCMEQDKMFRYIALELCQATLSEYIQGVCDTSCIQPMDILQQVTSGLAHLHHLDIVHRDVKPHNVLLSMPSNKRVRAMISDFGLCKKLQVGRMSFSRRSGVTGTDGWIAPEMLQGNERTTCAVDLFSLGCLFYYVLSKGCHPFGDALRRQANILSGEYDLSDLKGPQWQINLEIPLISALISCDPKERPKCNAVLVYPLFWNTAKILTFFQDVSDRVEKADTNDYVLQELEKNPRSVVKVDWRVHIHDEVARDLRKYRSYRGNSVRDLLRALRNKKHHFRELTQEAQDLLGEIPVTFTQYWINRFPLLFIHVYIYMQIVSTENTFKNYYFKNQVYSLKNYEAQVQNFIEKHPLPAIECFEENLEEKVTKSPRFQKYSPRHYQKLPKTENRNVQSENVGLYRNRVENLGTGDINQNSAKNSANNSANNIANISANNSAYYSSNRPYELNFKKKKKKATKIDEPLTWSVKE